MYELNVLGLKGWAFIIDWGSFLFGLKLAEADELIEIFDEEEGDADFLEDSTGLMFFVGPFGFMLIF